MYVLYILAVPPLQIQAGYGPESYATKETKRNTLVSCCATMGYILQKNKKLYSDVSSSFHNPPCRKSYQLSTFYLFWFLFYFISAVYMISRCQSLFKKMGHWSINFGFACYTLHL